ncbi:MAG: DNA mismatch repair protein MutS, partial [Atopostipes sp.]|nr:DNA mismatch repair protein MutS [Atopostipes sp.]
MFELFKKINRTHSSIGSEALYRRLRLFNFDNKEEKQLEKLIEFYKRNPKQRKKIEYRFSRLGKKDRNSVVQFLTESKEKKSTFLALYFFLGSLPLFGLLLLLSGLNQLGFLVLVGSVLFNLIYSMIKKVEIEMELMSMAYFIQSLQTAKKISKIDHPYQDKIIKLMKKFKSSLRFSFAFRMKDGTMMDVFLDYLNILFMIPFISYHYVFNRIKKSEEEAIELWQLLGELEIAYAVLNYRKTLAYYQYPRFKNIEKLKGRKVYHPLLEKPVANPVDWKRNTLVSGSNASGKSTYVKSVAINCVLAQTIHTVTAENIIMKRGHVLSSMAVEDDLVMGDSYFVAEIRSLKRILKQVKTKERSYLFIDEILRGTNTVERIAASSSIIHWLQDYPSLAFVATHDIELTEILKDECDNVHFKETITEEGDIQFHYELQYGPASSRNAILLLENMNFPNQVVENAKEKAENFDHTQEWLNF